MKWGKAWKLAFFIQTGAVRVKAAPVRIETGKVRRRAKTVRVEAQTVRILAEMVRILAETVRGRSECFRARAAPVRRKTETVRPQAEKVRAKPGAVRASSKSFQLEAATVRIGRPRPKSRKSGRLLTGMLFMDRWLFWQNYFVITLVPTLRNGILDCALDSPRGFLFASQLCRLFDFLVV